jgi:hypothetical protein
MGWRSGMRRKKIAPEAKVQVSFTPRERELVLEYTLAGPDVTGSIAAAPERRGKFSVPYTRDDLDELLGYIAAEANHCKEAKLRKELYGLFERLRKLMESYDDGQWQADF